MKFNKIFMIFILFVLALAVIASFGIIFSKKPRQINLPALPQIAKKASLNRANIYVMDIQGLIYFANQRRALSFAGNGADYYINRLRKINKLPNIKVVILRINSPGGTIAASQELYNQVKKLRKNGKIVISVIEDIGASGAYYIACASDSIVVESGSLTGSIGVLIAGFNMRKLFEKIGISYNIFKSGKYKDILSSYRDVTPEEKALLQDIVDSAYYDFYNAVKEGRKLDNDKMKTLADGRIFTGKMAVENGLADTLGGLDEALVIARQKGRILHPKTYYDNPSSIYDLTRMLTGNTTKYIEMLNVLNTLPLSYIYKF